MKPELIYSSIVYRKEMALKFVVYVLIGLFLLYISNHFLNNKFLSLLFLIAVVAPVFFLKLIMKRFIREVFIDLQEFVFSITIKNQEEVSLRFNFDEINTYSIQFPAGKFSTIILNFKNGKSVEYSFPTKKQNEEQINTEELINMFQGMIKNYNNDKPVKEQIVFVPSFMASSNGLICITLMVVLLIAAVFIHILYQAKTLPVTLFLGFALIVQLFLKRKADLDYYNKMRL